MRVEFAGDAEAAPFGHLLGRLIEGNLAAHPEREADFRRLRGRVGFAATDIQEAATLDFQGDHVVVHPGLTGGRLLTVHADSATIMQLSNLRIGPGGLPVYFDAVGREVLGKLLRHDLRVDGMTRHLGTLNRVTRLFSVR